MENACGRWKHKDVIDNRNIVLVFSQLLEVDKFYFGQLVCNHIVILSKRLHIMIYIFIMSFKRSL